MRRRVTPVKLKILASPTLSLFPEKLPNVFLKVTLVLPINPVYGTIGKKIRFANEGKG
jgi:hypothetical protein